MAIRDMTGLVWLGVWLAAGASVLGCRESTTHAPSDGTQTRTGELGTPVYFYASPTGTGTQCSVQQPCSLESAQVRVRAATPTMTGDIIVRLFAGTYRLTSPLDIQPKRRRRRDGRLSRHLRSKSRRTPDHQRRARRHRLAAGDGQHHPMASQRSCRVRHPAALRKRCACHSGGGGDRARPADVRSGHRVHDQRDHDGVVGEPLRRRIRLRRVVGPHPLRHRQHHGHDDQDDRHGPALLRQLQPANDRDQYKHHLAVIRRECTGAARSARRVVPGPSGQHHLLHSARQREHGDRQVEAGDRPCSSTCPANRHGFGTSPCGD